MRGSGGTLPICDWPIVEITPPPPPRHRHALQVSSLRGAVRSTSLQFVRALRRQFLLGLYGVLTSDAEDTLELLAHLFKSPRGFVVLLQRIAQVFSDQIVGTLKLPELLLQATKRIDDVASTLFYLQAPKPVQDRREICVKGVG